MLSAEQLIHQYKTVREFTVQICADLAIEDYIPQPIIDVSPPKWHLGHTAWFFEQFILKKHMSHYTEFHETFCYLFNSYYETVGQRINRAERGFLSRPTVAEVYDYRRYVDKHMVQLLGQTPISKELADLTILGLNHEQQHQELLVTDIKYILGHNPLYPKVNIPLNDIVRDELKKESIHVEEGNYRIGHKGDEFCFDNEQQAHTVFLNAYQISAHLVSNGEYIEFINDKGYGCFNFWHDEAWTYINLNHIKSPEYWVRDGNDWYEYTFSGLKEVAIDEPVCHISFYEAAAFAAWKGTRLPTEFEWEVAASEFEWGSRWEWTSSAYLPYPGFTKGPGAIGEYNGKFMLSQMVLKGASVATPLNHRRITYRNFFYPSARWQFTGIRLIT